VGAAKPGHRLDEIRDVQGRVEAILHRLPLKILNWECWILHSFSFQISSFSLFLRRAGRGHQASLRELKPTSC
jgi:hypothetical protein